MIADVSAVVYFVVAIVVYSLKFLWPWFDEITKAWQRPFSAILCYDVVSNGTGFTVFYSVGAITTSLTLALQTQTSFSQRLSLWLLLSHLIRRVAECLFLHSFSPAPMSLLNFTAGLSYYLAVSQAFATNSRIVDTSSVCSMLGAIFLCFMGLQFWSHRTLATPPHSSRSSSKYHVPVTGPFRMCLCPHYMSEIGIYVTLAALHPSPSAWLNVVFVILNLSHRAVSTREWYHDKFGPDVQRQSLLVPFVW